MKMFLNKHINKISIKEIYLILITILLIFRFLTTFNVYINGDEPFSINIIYHSFLNVFRIDSLDVHPPLYYFILKFFINILTFWTSSLFIKILFAKVFSFICFILTFIYLLKILNLLKIKISRPLLLVSFLIIPDVLIYSFQIRMYQLLSLFIVLEFYNLIKFDKNDVKTNLYLIYAVIFAILSSYTHYFGALFAGSMLLTYLIYYAWNKNVKKFWKILFAGSIFAIAFLPCAYLAKNQITYVMSNNYSNLMGDKLSNYFIIQLLSSLIGFDNISSISILIIGLFLFLFSIFLIIYSFQHLNCLFNRSLMIIICSWFISIIIPSILSLMDHSIFQARYMYPLFSIYVIFLIVIAIKMFSTHMEFYKSLIIIIIILLMIINVKVIKYTTVEDVKASNSISVARNWNDIRKKKCFFHFNNYNASTNTDLLIKESVYSNHMKYHPKIYVKNMLISQVLGSNNRKLLHKNFNNIYLNGKSK